jgi:DNA-binding NtrC family response regulator
MAESDLPPELPPEDPEEKARREQAEAEEAEAARARAEEAQKAYEKLAREYNLEADSENSRRLLENLDMDFNKFISKYKKGSIRRELDTGVLQSGRTVRDVLKLPGDVGDTSRKLLKEPRFDK